MRLSSQHRIAATVAYADIFDYPLTPEEVSLWIVGTPIRSILPDRTIRRFQEGNSEYVTLARRESLCSIRRKRAAYAADKWKLARRVAKFFYWIPTVMLVGVTGGLSMNNVKRDDDIDLFIITSPGALWISRLLISALTQVLGVRRLPGQKHVTDKICLNMFMAENCLALNPGERDLFGAHEVLQLQPIWQRDQTYARFLDANRWTKHFLPIAWEEKRKSHVVSYQSPRTLEVWILRLLEQPVRMFQLWYMKKRRTSEVIEPGVLRFHPLDARGWVRQKYANHLKRLKLPLDKIFYHR